MTVFGSYLKRKHFFFTSSRHLSDLTDVIAKDERKKVKKEIKGRDVSFLMEQLLSLDIILRFVTEWKVDQQLVRLLLVNL